MAGTDIGSGGSLIPDDIKRPAGELKDAVAHHAEDIAARSKDAAKEAGAAAIAAVRRTAGSIADTVAKDSPAIADYVRGAGQKIDRLAADLQNKNVGELLGSAAEFGRSRPVLLLAGAAVVGFALSRLIKAGVGSPGEAEASDKPSLVKEKLT